MQETTPTYAEAVSSVEIGRGATTNPKTPKHKRKSAQTPSKKKSSKTSKTGFVGLAKRGIKNISTRLTPGRSIDASREQPEPTAANLPTEITSSQDQFKKLFLANSPDLNHPNSDPTAYFVADFIGRPDESAAATRQMLDIIVLVSPHFYFPDF